MATFLLLLCIAAGCGVIGILFMLYGPTSSGFPRARPFASTGPTLGVSFAPPPMAFAPPEPFTPSPEPFVPVEHSLSTDFSVEEPVREVRIRGKSPSPPPLPAVTPLPPPPIPKAAHAAPPPLPKAAPIAPPPPLLPMAAQTIAIAAKPVRAEATPTTPPRLGVSASSSPPRLGVSAPSSRARPREPPRRMPAPLPRSRSARGSDAPPPSFATENQRTLPRELDEFSTAEHTFVD